MYLINDDDFINDAIVCSIYVIVILTEHDLTTDTIYLHVDFAAHDI